MSDSKVIVKKVNAFPFPAQFKSEKVAFTGKIMKLTKQGFLAEVTVSTLQPLEKMECAFTLPVMNKSVTEQVIVVKIYNHYVPATTGEKPPASTAAVGSGGGSGAQSPEAAAGKAAGIEHLVEMHFKPLSVAGEDAMMKFLNALDRSQK